MHTDRSLSWEDQSLTLDVTGRLAASLQPLGRPLSDRTKASPCSSSLDARAPLVCGHEVRLRPGVLKHWGPRSRRLRHRVQQMTSPGMAASMGDTCCQQRTQVRHLCSQSRNVQHRIRSDRHAASAPANRGGSALAADGREPDIDRDFEQCDCRLRCVRGKGTTYPRRKRNIRDATHSESYVAVGRRRTHVIRRCLASTFIRGSHVVRGLDPAVKAAADVA